MGIVTAGLEMVTVADQIKNLAVFELEWDSERLYAALMAVDE
jgi:hypothetical protein